MSMDGRKSRNGNMDRKATKSGKGNFKQKTLLDHFKSKTISTERQEHDVLVSSGDKPGLLLNNSTTVPYPCVAEDLTDVKEDFSIHLAEESRRACSNTNSQESNTPLLCSKVDHARLEDFTHDALGSNPLQPIVIDTSPSKKSPPSNPQSIHPFFARTSLSVQSAHVVHQTRHLPNVYPTSEMQHVKGTQTHFSVNEGHVFSRREKQDVTHISGTFRLEGEADHSLSSIPYTPINCFPKGHCSKEIFLQQIPESHMQQHPAIATVLSYNTEETSNSCGNCWVDKWRPRRAIDVLANESNAVYLRNWLQALELKLNGSLPTSVEQGSSFHGQVGYGKRGTKRARIVRSVEKRGGRKRQRMDPEDDNEIESVAYNSFHDDLNEPCMDGDAFQTFGLQNEPWPNQLCNTIILTGPSGSGKTSSVYACAEELGWKVFEVYPGIGKRNGSNLDLLIGDVGKNHILSKEAGLSEKGLPTTSVYCEGDMLPGNAELPTTEHKFTIDDSKPSIQQSVILLEEVDILYKEDANFWPAVVKFISQSRRPVICTCNDMSLVPISELPLQTILKMEPCSPSIAASYLQSISCAEGYMVDRRALLELCTQSGNTMEADEMLETPQLDLRQAIQTLQLRCTTDSLTYSSPVQCSGDQSSVGASLHNITPNQELASLRLLFSHAEYLSFADSEMIRKPGHTPLALHNSECTPCADDEVGHLILFDTRKGRGPSFGMYDHDEKIASAGASFSRGIVEAGIAQEPRVMEISGSSFDTESLLRARLKFRNKMDQVLRQVLPANTVSSGNEWLYMDYLPWIRHLLAADDEQEEQHMQTRRGRMTKNSGGYVRTITLTEEGRQWLEESKVNVE